MIDTNLIIEQYNNILSEALPYNYLVRETELQQAKINELQEFKESIKQFKNHFRDESDELNANTFFHFQCVLNSLISNLSLWILIKKADYRDAWNKLIDAQEYIEIAMRIDGEFFGVVEFYNHLKKMEGLIFPDWPVYMSIGLIDTGGKCSICNREYNTCDHLDGYVYMGTLCQRIERKIIKIDHCAVVENPYDRRCIVDWISTDDGKKRDYVTLKISDEEIEDKNGGRTMSAVVYHLDHLDLD